MMRPSKKINLRHIFAPAILTMFCLMSPAQAQSQDGASAARPVHNSLLDALAFDASYTADGFGVVSGGLARDAAYLDNISILVDLDLEKAFGWRGGALHVQGLSNLGGKPNSFAGTLEGIDNIEVADARPKLFELWLEQRFAQDRIQLGIGFFDLNASFYSNDAAGLFISPPFGIGSELASTGPSGPSIFPSTALGFSARAQINDSLYAQGAVVDASAGVLGDAGGYQASLSDGVLLIGELGAQDEQRGKIAIGFWGYSNKQPRLLVREDEPETTPAQGVYLLAELKLNHPREDVRMLRAFARIGASDADTTPFAGGAQAGLHLARPFANRADSAFGIGVHYGAIFSAARFLAAQDGLAPSRGEYGVEITYADQLTPWLSIQPDVQILFHPGGDREAPLALVAGLRLTLAFAKGG